MIKKITLGILAAFALTGCGTSLKLSDNPETTNYAKINATIELYSHGIKVADTSVIKYVNLESDKVTLDKIFK